MDNIEKKILIDRILKGMLAVAALIFSVSYAFGQYVHFRESNILDLNTWINCVKTEQLSDRAYEFCREKAEESYIFKNPYDWNSVTPTPAVPVENGTE